MCYDYGLNPYVYGEDNPNSPFYVSPCDVCRKKTCEGCEYIDEEEDDNEL